MLKKLKITNFQSHKDTKMDLSGSVNTIQGNSDCGKSAVMRSLCWLLFNPAGDYFVSDWARKGKMMSAPCEVTVESNGHIVTRRRDKDFNGYILDGEVFEATRNSVPPLVLEAMGLGEVNVQRQLDPPFLLSMSPGEVSRYVNSLVNLTRIDKWVTAVNSRSRHLQQELDSATSRVESAQKTLDGFGYLDELGRLSEDISALESKMKITFVECESLSEGIGRHTSVEQTLEAMPDVDAVSVLLEEASGVMAKMTAMDNSISGLASEISRRESVEVPDVPDMLFPMVDTLSRWKSVLSGMGRSIGELGGELSRVEELRKVAEASESEMEPLLKQLESMVCPMCGRSGIHSHVEEEK